MDKIKVVYVVNGTTLTDILVGMDVSIQRFGSSVALVFPERDGLCLSAPAESQGWRQIAYIDYAQCEKIERFADDRDIPTEVS